MLPVLNFPPIDTRFSGAGTGSPQVFDIVRKKFVDLTPEEWVRQHVVHFLIHHKGYPLSLIGIEKQLKLNNTIRRTDVVVYDNSLKPLLLIECKADSVPITQQVADQALRYNIPLQVPYVLLTNGLKHVCFYVKGEEAGFLKDIPDYGVLMR